MGGSFTGKSALRWFVDYVVNRVINRSVGRMTARAAAVVILAALMLVSPVATLASQSESFTTQSSLSAAQAAAIVRSRHGGRVLSVVPSSRGDEQGYRVRVLIGGERVKTVFVGDQRRQASRSKKTTRQKKSKSRNRN